MDFGGVEDERVALNEDSLWSGSAQDSDRTNAAAALPEIRRLLLEGKNAEAEKLVNRNFTCAGRGSANGHPGEVPYGSYEVLGDLRLKFAYADTNEATGYRRELDLTTATAHTEFSRGGVKFTRDIFVSAPDQVIVIRLAAEEPGQIDFEAALDRPERFETEAAGDNELLMTGAMTNGAGGEGVKYAARLRVLNTGGKMSVAGGKISVSGANEAVLLISAATDYERFSKMSRRDVAAAAKKDLDAAAKKDFSKLLEAHVADYQQYFNRVKLELPSSETRSIGSKPTPERLAARNLTADPSLAVLYFNFGRYLLISSSRPGGMPANLQGLWADTVAPPWGADYHLNVNIQMIYWPAEVCNLTELNEPLFAYIESLQASGAKTAKEYYGARGWVAHVLANAWGFTSPGESAAWGLTPSDAAWLCHHLWEHWQFTGDKEFLKQAYPVLRGSAEFFSDTLIEEPTHHWLVTAPANSPENAFTMTNGQTAHVCLGPTLDNQLLRFLFGACIESADILGVDKEFAAELKTKRDRLPPTRIGSDGRVMEWPGRIQVGRSRRTGMCRIYGACIRATRFHRTLTPELAEAAREIIERARGHEHGLGNGVPHMALWARLHDGDRTFKLLQNLLQKPAGGRGTDYGGSGGLGRIRTCLMRIHRSRSTAILAARRRSRRCWCNHRRARLSCCRHCHWRGRPGKFSGLRARGGYELGIKWNGGKLASATIRNVSGSGPVKVRYGGKAVELTLKQGEAINFERGT